MVDHEYYKVEAMRKTLEILQAQVQLLTLRVESLEGQLSLGGAHNQPLPMPFGASGQSAPTTSPNTTLPSGMYYWAPGQPLAANNVKPSDEEQRLTGGVTGTGEDSHQGNVNSTLSHLQQQLSMLMAQHQREEAEMAMIHGNSSPNMTPTTLGSLYFPSATAASQQQQQTFNAAGASLLGSYNSGLNPGIILPTANSVPLANVHGLYSPVTAANSHTGMGAFMSFPTTVTMDPNHASNEALEAVCQQPWLREVCLKGCRSISNFMPLTRLRNLWKLNLQGCSLHVDDSVLKLLSIHNKRLSRLNFCGCERITDATSLSQLLFLFDLNLSGCLIRNDSLAAISNGCPQISRLAINSCPNITDISCVGKLKDLKLLYCRYSCGIVPSSIVEMLSMIGASLLTLNIDGLRFESLDTIPLPPVVALKHLNMKDNTELTSLEWLTNAENASKVFAALEMIDAEGCSNLTNIGNIAALPSLKVLRLNHTMITPTELQKVTGCKALSTLCVDGCSQIQHFTFLLQVPSLTELVVDSKAKEGSLMLLNGLQDLLARGVEVVAAPPTSSNFLHGMQQ